MKALRKEESGTWEEFEPRFRVVKPYRPQKVKKQPQLELAFDHIPIKPTLAEQRRRAFDGFRFSMPKPAAGLASAGERRDEKGGSARAPTETATGSTAAIAARSSAQSVEVESGE